LSYYIVPVAHSLAEARINFQNTTIARHFMPLSTLDVTSLRRKNNAKRAHKTTRFVQES